MTFSIKYNPLFQVEILHNYFLNKGVDEYNSMSSAEKAEQLDSYEISSFVNILPTPKSQQIINGHNLVFKTTNNGFTVWSKVTGNNNNIPFISLADDLSFTFLVQLKDAAFYNYTNLKLENADKLYYFSNRKLDSELSSFPMINKSGNNSIVDQHFVLSDTGANDELSKLSANEKDNLFALIRIFVKGKNGSLHITNVNGRIKNPVKTFEILFNNRKTIWRYFFNENQQVKPGDDVKKEAGNAQQLITKVVQPLTQKGFISIELDGNELPNPDARMIKPNTSNTKYYSETYI